MPLAVKVDTNPAYHWENSISAALVCNGIYPDLNMNKGS